MIYFTLLTVYFKLYVNNIVLLYKPNFIQCQSFTESSMYLYVNHMKELINLGN